MAIFGRSKKSKPTTPLQCQPPNQSHQQYSYPEQQTNVGNWQLAEQRPHVSNFYAQPQSQGWMVAPIPPPYQPILVQQQYQAPPALQQRPYQGAENFSTLKLSSVNNLLASNRNDSINNDASPLYLPGVFYVGQEAGLCDLISSKLNNVITLIDGERFSGDERELAVFPPPAPILQQQQETGTRERGLGNGKSKGMVNNPVSSALTSSNYFAKVHLYANSRLPPNFPPMKL